MKTNGMGSGDAESSQSKRRAAARHGFFALILAVTVAFMLPLRGEETEGWTRIAVIAASQRGMGGDRPLRYAYQDGERLEKMLSTVGQVEPDNLFFLKVEGKAAFQDSLQRIGRRIAALKGENRKVFLQFYYTGHGGAKHFHFADGQMSFDELKDALGSDRADARVYVLDVCFGASFFNSKGFKTAPPVQLQMEMDRAAHGEVTISSSSVNEQAYEVRNLGGSIFTSQWIMALRGAGDRNRDGQVTLFEAYNYAYDRTAGYSAETLDRPQHPSYQIDLTGARDVMLARLLRTSTGILFRQCPAGLYNLVDLQKGIQIGELRMPEGDEFTLALEPGSYRVQYLPAKGAALGADVELAAAAMTPLPFTAFQTQTGGDGIAKGSLEVGDTAQVETDAGDDTGERPKVTEKLPSWPVDRHGRIRKPGFWRRLGYSAFGGAAVFRDPDLLNGLNRPPAADQYFGITENFTNPGPRPDFGVSMDEPLPGGWSFGAELALSGFNYSETATGRENLASVADSLRGRYPVKLNWSIDFLDFEIGAFLGRNVWVTQDDLLAVDAGIAYVQRTGSSTRTVERTLYATKSIDYQNYTGDGYRMELGITYRRVLSFGFGRRRFEAGARFAPYLLRMGDLNNGLERNLNAREIGASGTLVFSLPGYHGGNVTP